MLPEGLRPTPEASAHSARLAALIRREIAAARDGLPFERFMELALYAPGLGYYSAGATRFGAAGDFVTAPEISPLYSRCLARQCAQVLSALGGGEIVEVGAGSGAMAADMLAELEALDRLPRRYSILELGAGPRRAQAQTLAARVPHLTGRVRWLEHAPEAGLSGVVLANEVLDAMPVRRFEITARGPRPLHVVAAGEGFGWCHGAPDPELDRAVRGIEAALDAPLPTGYVSELNPRLAPWVALWDRALAAGLVLLVDYGYPRREYYHPERSSGTLLCHYRHHVHADPLVLVGLQDISASVDFTALAEARGGLELWGYTGQAHLLLGCGLAEMMAELDPEDTRAYLTRAQEVKRLTLPDEMGERCKAIAFGRPTAPRDPLIGFSHRDARARL